MAKFIEVTRIFDFGSSYEKAHKMIINIDLIESIEDSGASSMLTTSLEHFFISEPYEEIKEKLGV